MLGFTYIPRGLMAGVLFLAAAAMAPGADPPPEAQPASVPPWQRLLRDADAMKAEELLRKIAALQVEGKFEDTLREAESLADLHEKVQGKNHWETVEARQRAEGFRRVLRQKASVQSALTQTYPLRGRARELENKNNYREAVPLRERILSTCRDAFGEDHPFTAQSYRDLADALREAGKYAEAEPLLRKALQINRKAFGEENPSTAGNYVDLALVVHEQARYAEADGSYRKGLSIYRRVLGEEHPTTARALNNLALNMDAMGLYTQAEVGFRKALAISRSALGENHPDVVNHFQNLALNLDKQGRYPEAEVFHRKALAISRKVSGEDSLNTASCYAALAGNLTMHRRHPEVEELMRKALALRRKVLGEDHPQTAASYANLATLLLREEKYADAEGLARRALDINRRVLGEQHPDTGSTYDTVAASLKYQGRYGEAEEFYRKGLSIRRKALGEDHAMTARSYDYLASNLSSLGRYSEAEENSRKALAIRIKALGDRHPETGQTYNNLAVILDHRGKSEAAEELFRKALKINRNALGETHFNTAQVYGNLAGCLRARGRFAEAEEGFYKALTIWRKAFGDESINTSYAFNNLALSLMDQGKHSEAEQLNYKALDICRKILGEEHSETAASYNNLAACLGEQGNNVAAEMNFRKALSIDRKVLGEEHPSTATTYHNLASCLHFQGKHTEAEELERKALDIQLKVFGEEHSQIANSYISLASSLQVNGKYEEAAGVFRKALTANRKFLGDEHPETVRTYRNLAQNSYYRTRFAEAEDFNLLAADGFAKARTRIAATGLGRAAKTTDISPLPLLVFLLARNGKAAAAGQRYEEMLGRGAWDDLSARLVRSPQERARQIELSNQLDQCDQLLDRAVSSAEPAEPRKKRVDDLLSRRLKLQDELTSFEAELQRRYGPTAGQIFDTRTIQAAVARDTALIGWHDLTLTPKSADPKGEHLAFVLRSDGEPAVVRLSGSGPEGAWTEADIHLPAELSSSLQRPGADWEAQAERLRKQRIAPLEPYLGGVRRVVILPSSAVAGIPTEVFAGNYTVSYALSGTMYAHLKKHSESHGNGMLALADPVFERPGQAESPRPLPPGGLLITMVAPGSNAHRNGLKPGDVLLRYGDADFKTVIDLTRLIETHGKDESIHVTLWREERTEPFVRTVQPGKLGVVLASDPAPQAVEEMRRIDRRLASRGDDPGKWAPLPATRVEADALRGLFGSDALTVLSGSDASEQQLYERAKRGDLAKYRYLHLATHGLADNRSPLRSALILSRDHLPDPGKQLDAGLPVFDGELTAEEVLRDWNLDAELVTLSACQTALGKQEGGEGFVGFAQALTLAGSRSVCLSLWNVNDTATALLMRRFYENLLGKRQGLREPMKKAAALAEAKAWLRGLTRDEALRLIAEVTKGADRGKHTGKLPTAKEGTPETPAPGEHPYAHPYYWAPFVLFGEAD
jgi:tetratricopeptide (TPR) repeat protein